MRFKIASARSQTRAQRIHGPPGTSMKLILNPERIGELGNAFPQAPARDDRTGFDFSRVPQCGQAIPGRGESLVEVLLWADMGQASLLLSDFAGFVSGLQKGDSDPHPLPA